MAFPTTSVLDSFNRADENPLSNSGKWSSLSGLGLSDLKLLSNQCTIVTTSAESGMYWNVSTFTDSEVFVTVNTNLSTTDDHIYIGVRFNEATFSGYALRYRRITSGTDEILIVRLDGGELTTLASYSQNISNNDVLGLSVIGNSLTAYYNGTALGVAVTDSNYTSAGRLLLDISATLTGPGVVNFGGGTVKIVNVSAQTMTLNLPSASKTVSPNAPAQSIIASLQSPSKEVSKIASALSASLSLPAISAKNVSINASAQSIISQLQGVSISADSATTVTVGALVLSSSVQGVGPGVAIDATAQTVTSQVQPVSISLENLTTVSVDALTMSSSLQAPTPGVTIDASAQEISSVVDGVVVPIPTLSVVVVV